MSFLLLHCSPVRVCVCVFSTLSVLVFVFVFLCVLSVSLAVSDPLWFHTVEEVMEKERGNVSFALFVCL